MRINNGLRKSEEMVFIALAVITILLGIFIVRNSMIGMSIGESKCTELSDCRTIIKTPDTSADERGHKIYVAINNNKYERFYMRSQPTYAYFSWVNNINSSRTLDYAILKIKHRESGADLKIEWYNGTNWIQVCDPPNRKNRYIDSCNLSNYINTADKANNVRLRVKMTKTDQCHVDIDWVELSIQHCKCQKQSCIENWIANYTECRASDQNTKYYIDLNSCGTKNNLPGDNGTYGQCNYCSYNIINSSWSEWLNYGECLGNNSQMQKRSMAEYDINYLDCYSITGLGSDLWNSGNNNTYDEYRYVECDYCTPELLNSSWSDWYDITGCMENDTIMQQRYMVQYDLNECHEIANQTSYETQTIYCDYCVPSLVNSSWTEWYGISECEDYDAILQERKLEQYDLNECGETENRTFYEIQEAYCDYCIPYLLNTSWTGWENISCAEEGEMNQSRSLIQYDANYCGEIDNSTIGEYRLYGECGDITPDINETLLDNNETYTNESIEMNQTEGNDTHANESISYNETQTYNETQEDSGEEEDSGDSTPPAKTSSSGGGGGGGGSYSGYIKCNESWVCSDWLECFNNVSTRDCEDMNLCGTTKQMPNLTKPCEEEYGTEMTAQPGHGGSSLKPIILNETDRDKILLKPKNRQTGFIARNLEMLRTGYFADYLTLVLALIFSIAFILFMFIERRDSIDMEKFREQARRNEGLKIKESKINLSSLGKGKHISRLRQAKASDKGMVSKLEKICEENKNKKVK